MDTIRKIISWLRGVSQTYLFFWIALILLNILLFLPQTIFHPGQVNLLPLPPLHGPRGWYDTILFFVRRENQDFFRIIAEYLLIVTALFFFIPSAYPKFLRRLLFALYLFFFLYQCYDSIMVLVFGESPILYNDLSLLKGAFYLVIDIIFTSKFLTLLGATLLLLSILGAIFYCFAVVEKGLEKWHHRPGILRAGAGIWGFVIIMTMWFGFRDFRAVVQWITPKIVKNVKHSFALRNLLQEVKRNPVDSTYYSYQNLPLQQKPNIFLIMLESYGKILVERDEIKMDYLSLLSRMEDSLQQEGWRVVSNFSQAPIFGGRSWLSMGTLLTGTLIKDEVIYSYFINRSTNYPHLVQFFNHQGYHTFALQPLNRSRPGYTFTSYEKFYHYQTYLNFADLNFDGPAFGFRNIPDQYSLNYAYETYIQNSTAPIFLFFLTVSSHSPWIDLPPYVEDWHRIKEKSQQRLSEKYADTQKKIRESFLSHFSSGTGLKEYLDHMIYELHMVQDFILRQVPPNSIIIVIGDHQPPITLDLNPSFETPLHIISQDEKFLHSFEKFGFKSGLKLDEWKGKSIKHEGFYSLLIHNLAQNYSQLDVLPPYLENGIPLSITP